MFFVFLLYLKINFNYNLINNQYFYYFSLTLKNPVENFVFFVVKTFKINFSYNISFNFLTQYLFIDFLTWMILKTSTSIYYFIFFIICLIWPIQRYFNRQYHKLIIFIKIIAVLCIFFLRFRPFIFAESFWNTFDIRLFEIITPYMILITSIGILFLSIKIPDLFNSLIKNIKKKYYSFKKKEKKKEKILAN